MICFPDDLWCWTLFFFILPESFVCFLWKKSLSKSCAHFLIRLSTFLLLICISSLYILNINPLLDIWLANISLHSVGCLSLCWCFPLLHRKSFSLMQFINFFFSCPCLWSYIQKTLLRTLSRSLLPMFFSQDFMVSGIMWSESCSVLSDSLLLHGLYSPWNSPAQNTGVGSLSLLQGIFPTQGSNLGLPLYRRFYTIWATREAQEYCIG